MCEERKSIFRLRCHFGGVPQGSALGHFLGHVNDVPSQVSHGCLLQVADDTCLICSGDSAGAVVQMLQEDLHLSLWDKAKS